MYKQQKEDAERKKSKYKLKYENYRILIENNEILTSQLDESRKEVMYLKLQVNKLEETEKRLHTLIMQKVIIIFIKGFC